MHPRIKELFALVDRGQATLESAVGAVPPALRSTPQSVDRWSVAQVIQHLNIVEGRITGLVARLIAEGKANGLPRERDDSSIIASIMADRYVDRSTKLVFGGAPPDASIDADAGLRSLATTRIAFKAAVMEGDGLDLSVPKFDHRAFGPLTAYEWIALVGLHMERHADQIREIGESVAARA
jgi:hypothetical protein